MTPLAIIYLPLVFVALLVQFMPLLTRKGIYFGATVRSDFPESEEGRRVLRSYRIQTALWTLVGFAALLVAGVRPDLRLLVPMLIVILGSSVSYWLKFREVHGRYGERRPEIRQAELTPLSTERNFSAAVILPPFLALACVALYLVANWGRLPEMFPVHWGPDGLPNRWMSRTALGVFAPLLMGTGTNLVLLGLTWLISSQTRRTVMQRITIRLIIAMLYPMTFTFCVVGLLPLYKFPMWVVPLVMLATVTILIYQSYQLLRQATATDAVPEPQSDDYWKAGMFYYNPNDPAIFVSKRVGVGYTMNFANKASWVVLAGFLVLALLPLLLLHQK